MYLYFSQPLDSLDMIRGGTCQWGAAEEEVIIGRRPLSLYISECVYVLFLIYIFSFLKDAKSLHKEWDSFHPRVQGG